MAFATVQRVCKRLDIASSSKPDRQYFHMIRWLLPVHRTLINKSDIPDSLAKAIYAAAKANPPTSAISVTAASVTSAGTKSERINPGRKVQMDTRTKRRTYLSWRGIVIY
jgi:ribosomal protein S7